MVRVISAHPRIGVTPKSAARVWRFERACWLMANKRAGLAHIAIACGYYDQPHRTREWNTLAGCSPRTWIAREPPFLQDYELGAGLINPMTLNPCINLSFNGQCEAAFEFYERCLNGKITFILTWRDSPMAKDVPLDWASKICHATLVVGDSRLQGSDPAPGSYESPRGFGITLNPIESKAGALFAALAGGGTVHVPLQKTFWAAGFGMLTDRFGIPWIVNCEQSE